MDLKLSVGQIDVVKERDFYVLRMWDGDKFQRLGGPSKVTMAKDHLRSLRDQLNRVLKDDI